MADGDLLQVISYIDTVNRKYPRLAPFLDIPQVGRLILLLASNKIEPDEFERRLKNTAYWKKTSEAQRRWRILKYQDPATAERRVDARLATVRDLASNLGVTLPDKVKLRALAARTLARDMTEEEMTDMLLSFTSYADEGRGAPGPGSQNVPRGALGATVLQIRDLARQYMIAPSARQQFNDAKRILSGAATVESLAASYAQRALQRYGSNATLRDHLAQGGTLAEFFDPYREMIAEELELPPDSVDLMQPRWEAMLNTVTGAADDPANSFGYKGTQQGSAFRPMTLSEARAWVRKRPEWGNSRGAKQKVAALGEVLGQRFGAVA